MSFPSILQTALERGSRVLIFDPSDFPIYTYNFGRVLVLDPKEKTSPCILMEKIKIMEVKGEKVDTENETTFNSLPVEIKEMILTKLNKSDQMNARVVCKEWEQLLSRKFNMKLTLDDNRLELFKQFDENKRIDELVVKNFQIPLVSKSSTRSGLSKNIRCLFLGAGVGFPGDPRRDPNSPYSNMNPNFYRETGYFVGHEEYVISPINMKILLEMNPGIEVLRVCGTALSGMGPKLPSLKGLRLENLTVLDIHFTSMRRPFRAPAVDPYVKLLQNCFPSLHTLQYSSTAWKADLRLWVAVFQCIAAHRRTLKTLKIFHTTVYSLQNCVERGKWFPEKKYVELQNCIREVKLNYLLLDLVKCGPNIGQRWRSLERDLLDAQTSLVNFAFIGNAREIVDSSYTLMFSSIRNTISSLEIYWHCLLQPPFDCSSLSQCTQLKSLKLNIKRTGYQIFDPDEKFYLNMHKLPTGIVRLLCGPLINDSDAVWISKNMLNLEEIGYACLIHQEDTQKTLEHFLMYLNLPNLRLFRINNYKCNRIARFVENTCGLSISNSGHFTEVTIDRDVFKHSCFSSIRFRLLII